MNSCGINYNNYFKLKPKKSRLKFIWHFCLLKSDLVLCGEFKVSFKRVYCFAYASEPLVRQV